MEGKGHFPDWGKEKNEKSAQSIMRNMQMKKKKKNEPKNIQKIIKQKKEREKQEKVKPTHFDLEPFLKAFKDFVAMNSEVRSKIRMEMKKESDAIDYVFVDEYGEKSYKKCVDIMSLEKLLAPKNVVLHQHQPGTVGKLLRCFGEISYQLKEVIKMPDKDPKEIAKEQARKKAEEEAKAKEKEEKGAKRKLAPAVEDEDSEEVKKKAPPRPINVKLYETSIHDMYQAIEKMQDYDFTFESMGVIKGNLDEEKIMEGVKTRNEEESDIDITGDQNSEYVVSRKSKAGESYDEDIKYSEDLEYNKIVQDLDDLEAIPDPPEKAKNAFAITLFCIELAFDSRSRDFLQYAFDLYPDRDYLIVTQPHTVAESTLLQKFTCVEKKIQNTFPHVLYIIHRDSLLDIETIVRRAVPDDIEDIHTLTAHLDNKQVIDDDVYNAIISPESIYQAYVAKILNTIIGIFVISKDVNLNYYKSHFHIQDSILLPEHDRRGHTKILHSVVNPIYERNTRYCLKEILRLSAKTCCYFEIANHTVIPQIFKEMINVRTRRFPHFLKRKWDHERNVYEDNEEENREDMDGADRDPLDEEDAPFALCFITRRLLSEPKIVKNSRIVVIGSSDTGISFIEALLSISYLRFTNIILVSPGGLPHHHFVDHIENLKAYSTSYTNEELKRLMLENRIKVINARMVDIDRKAKNVILHDDAIIPYDTLILAMGLQDQTLNTIGYSSKGISPTPEGKLVVEGLLSIDDPFLYDHLSKESELIKILCNRKKKNDVVVYGRTLNAYCCIQGLINRGVRPENVFLIIPDAECHLDSNYDEEDEMQADIPFINPEAFKDPDIRQKIHDNLLSMGVTIYEHCLIQTIETDDTDCLKSVLFKRLDIPEEDEGEDDDVDYADQSKAYHDGEGDEEDMFGEGEGGMHIPKRKRKKNELPIDCKVMITAGHRNVDPDVFNSIHNNGLVYNGRLIVDKNFQTTDPSIFAAGALCEFSGRYAAISQIRSIRLDRYNGREMGSRLARSVFDIYDPAVAAASQEQSSLIEEELPSFFLPQGYGGKVPGNYWFYDTYTTNPLRLKNSNAEQVNRNDLMCDNIKEDGQGTLIKFTFNQIGLIDSVTYYGTEEIIIQSLWSFVGLHENYLNMLTSRFEGGIISNAVEFLSENWAMALYHEWFGDFCLRMRQGIQGMADIQEILKKVFDESQNGEGITRDRMAQLRKMMDPETVKMIEDETLEFIKVNLNHLPMYFIPGDEFDYGSK